MLATERDTDLITETLEHGVLTLTLGAPPAHPLSLAMIDALHAAITRAAQNDAAKVIVIHGPGNIFCAGHDLKEIARHRADADCGRDYLQRLFDRCAQMMQALTLSPKPTIAMVEGIATAGGLQLVAACDLAFAADSATFCLPGINNKGFCTTPAVAVARNLTRKHVMEMLLSGDTYDAQWARETGLINRALPVAELPAFVEDFARKLASRYGENVADGKRTLYRQVEMPLAEAYAHATEAMIGHFMDPDLIEHDQKAWGA